MAGGIVARTADAALTDAHTRRLEQANYILREVDLRPLPMIIEEMNRTASPEGNLQIYEAVAATYQEIVDRKHITDSERKQSLYDSIRMNVAFMQFGGGIEHKGDKVLDRWIRQTLARHLPEGVFDNDQLFHSLK